MQQKKTKNLRGSFTRILGSKEALYELGINVHDENEFIEENALMTMPPANVLRALDPESFVVGLEPATLQDPFGFVPLETNPSGSRPRKSTKKAEKVENFQQEIDDIVMKTVKLVESKLGRKIFGKSNLTKNLEEECQPDSMKRTQDKCNVSHLQIK